MAMTKDRVKVYNISGDTRQIVQFLDSFKTLVCRGFHFDAMCTLGNAHGYDTVHDSPSDKVQDGWGGGRGEVLLTSRTLEVIGTLKSAQRSDHTTGGPSDWVQDGYTGSMGIYNITGETLQSALFRTVVADYYQPDTSAENGQRGYSFTSTVYDVRGLQGRDRFPVYGTCHTRRLFTSHKGYLGMAPEEAQEGDLICILLGGEVLFVLRMDDEGHFYLIGECYVHCIMDGEAMREVEEGRISLQDFVIK